MTRTSQLLLFQSWPTLASNVGSKAELNVNKTYMRVIIEESCIVELVGLASKKVITADQGVGTE